VQPSRADAENHPSAGQQIERRDQFGGYKQLAFRQQAYSGADLDPASDGSGDRQCDKWIEPASVMLG
jgi:hypothetical protein